MHPAISERLATIGEITERKWFRVLAMLWFLSGAWDLALSQFVPEQYAKRLPKIYQVVAVTIGVVPWEAWVLVGAMIVAAGAIEYAFRHKRRLDTSFAGDGRLSVSGDGSKRHVHPKTMAIAAGILVSLVFGGGVVWWFLREPSRSIVAYEPMRLAYLATVHPDSYQEEMAVYLGKWTRSVNTGLAFPPKKECLSGKRCTINVNATGAAYVHMSFDADRWESIIIATPPNQLIVVECQIKDIKPGEFFGQNCEIE